MMNSIKQQAISGVKWTSAARITTSLLQLLNIAVLTRFLEKSDFGLLAIAMFIMGFAQLFMDMGLTVAILHKQNISQNEYSSLYWLNFFVSIIIYLVIIFITPLVTSFYKESELSNIIPIIGLSVIISSIGRQHKTIRQKELDFKFIAVVEILSVILMFILAVYLAIKGFGVYSIIWATLLKHFIENVFFLLTGIKKNGIRLYFNYRKAQPFLKIGLYQTGSEVINYFNREVDILIVGRLLGIEILGIYNLAKQLIRRPIQIIDPIINRVAAPVLAIFQHDIANLKNNYQKLIGIVSVINIPVYIGIGVIAEPLVRILYGQEFIDCSILVTILSLNVVLRVLGNLAGNLVIATGHTNRAFIWNLIVLMLNPIFIYFGAKHSIEMVAFSQVILIIILFIPHWYFLIFKLCKLMLKDYIVKVGIPLFIGLFSGLITYFLFKYISLNNSSIKLFIELSCFGLLYFICLIVFFNSYCRNVLITLNLNNKGYFLNKLIK